MKVSRIVLLFVYAFGSIVIPVLVGLLVGFLGYKPIFTIDEAMVAADRSWSSLAAGAPGLTDIYDEPTPKYPGARQVIHLTYDDGGQALLLHYDTPDQAKEAKDGFLQGVPTSSVISVVDTIRYHRQDTLAYGLLFRDRSWVMASESPTEGGRMTQLEGLPFLTKQDKSLVSALFEDHLPWFFIGLGIYLLFLTVTWLKLGSWAAQVDAVPGIPPVDVSALKQLLLSINNLDVPFGVKSGKRENEYIVEWKYADAKWFGPLTAGRLKAMARIRLRLDPNRHEVQAQDTNTSVRWDAQAGPTPRMHLSFFTFRGIEFISTARGTEYGLLFKDGRLSFRRAYDYTFDRSEMKQPIIDMVTGSGWTFRPVVSFLPFLS